MSSYFKTWVIATVVAAGLYISTAAPGLIWGDSGDAQVRVLLGHCYDQVNWSRSHILFYLIARGITALGIDPARTATLLSALAGAVTVGNVALLMRMIVGRGAAVVAAVGMFALSHSLWHLSTVAEVMTLSTMWLSLELICVYQFTRTRRAGWLVAALFVNGLGLATHNLAMLTWPAYGALVITTLLESKPIRARTLFMGLGAMLIGASPVIALFIYLCAHFASPGVVLREMLMGRYGPFVQNTNVSVSLVARMMGYTAYCFPTPIALAAIGGVLHVLAQPRRAWPAFLITAFLLFFGFAVRYNVADQHVFMLHSYVIAVLFVAFGVDRWLQRRPSRLTNLSIIGLSLAAPLVYAAVPIALRNRAAPPPFPTREVAHRDSVTWFLRPWHSGDDGPETFAREILSDAPPDIVLSIDSTLMPPLLYLQNAEGKRRDVQIIAADAYQPWFAASIDAASQCDDLVRRGQLYAVTTDRKYWNHCIKGPQYDAVPSGRLFQIVRNDAESVVR